MREIFNYNHTVREIYISRLRENLSWTEIIKYRGTKLKSLKDTLLHIVWVEDTWINYTLHGTEDPNRPFPYDSYRSWADIISYNTQVVNKVNNFLYSLTSIGRNEYHERLKVKVYRINNDGTKRSSAVKDVLFHVITEDLHHRGELVAILWQMNIRPPDMGWLSVMRKTSPQWDMPDSRHD
jgi:uncharacterized damage-inducible protein DinB